MNNYDKINPPFSEKLLGLELTFWWLLCIPSSNVWLLLHKACNLSLFKSILVQFWNGLLNAYDPNNRVTGTLVLASATYLNFIKIQAITSSLEGSTEQLYLQLLT